MHLCWLMITVCTSRFQVLLVSLVWPGRIFHSSSCPATQNVKGGPVFQTSIASPWVSAGQRKIGGEREKESESLVEARQLRNKPDLLSPKIRCRCQLTASPLLPIRDTHAKISSVLKKFSYTHKHTDTQACADRETFVHRSQTDTFFFEAMRRH